ncbi:TetR family transcriptional regulator [Amycolatopsis thermoflava]|uniref:TetR family transcriptional regulator n=2 Tax=Pseudonocardiaceae TaxID=2070 RepID=A0A3N2H0A1_9PSEU|nr:TetR family transcriptional regulator [Amycolatopsis thermoflava]
MTGPTRRKRMPRAQREQQMLEVAEAVFAERGFAAASMDEIAERVGVSKPMLYEYFNSKEGLLLACVAQARAELREVTERAVAGQTDAREALRSGLRAFFVFARERRQGWSLLRHELALIGTSASDALEDTRRQQTDLIAKLMAQYFDAGEAGHLLLEATAELVVGACERLAIWCEQHDEVTPDLATDLAMEVLWTGLGLRTQ